MCPRECRIKYYFNFFFLRKKILDYQGRKSFLTRPFLLVISGLQGERKIYLACPVKNACVAEEI